MLKGILGLILICSIFSVAVAYGDELNSSGQPTNKNVFPVPMYKTQFSPIAGWKPYVSVSYLRLHENETAYLDTIKNIVEAHWLPPKAISATAIVWLEIDKDGTISNTKILCSSGSGQHDQAALQAVSRVHQLARPPKDLRLPAPVAITFNTDPRVSEIPWGEYRSPVGIYLAPACH